MTAAASRSPGLPTPLTPLIGREREVAAVTDVLRDEHARLVTLTGPGGTGKTRLAIQVSSELAGSFRDGVVFVSLAPVRDSELVIPAIAQALGVREAAGQPLLASLVAALGDRSLLLVLDNFEQIVSAAPLLSDLLGACSGVSLLVTSRVPLHLYGERVVAVPPLAVPDASNLPPVDELARVEAVRLFTMRAQAAQSSFTLNANNAATVADICVRLDGLPLAIELAAARVAVFGPQELATRLDRRLPLLVGGPRDVPERQQTLRATIAWSYDLLQPEDQLLLRRLSILKSGWTLDAAEALVAGEAGAPPDALSSLVTLLEHSLIQRREGVEGTARFTMLETIREFGLEQLEAAGEVDEAHRRYLAYLLTVFTGPDLTWQGPTTSGALRRGDAEVENLRVALDWSLEHDPEQSLRLARAVSGYWFSRGAFREARRRIAQTLANAPDVAADLRAGAVAEMGMHATTYGDFESAQSDIEAALALYRDVGDGAGEATCLFLLGRNAAWASEPERAVTLYEQALPGLRQHGVVTLPIALSNLANVLIQIGQLDRAAEALAEALEHSERRGEVWAVCAIFDVLGGLAIQRGDTSGAREAFRRCLEIQQELQDPRYIAQILEGCAALAATDGAYAHAARLIGVSDRLRESIGMSTSAVTDRNYERAIQLAREQLSEAEWEQAWTEGRSLSQSEAIAAALEGLTDTPAPIQSADHQPSGLSPREIEVLRLLVEGRTDREIGAELFISHHTVARHVSSILGKLGVESRTAAATWAVRHDLS
ncbi:MAG TPA: LuxR C-terminal-related transcriptional regulator [Thermomicrobiales bacterium]|nr:LuxR C-terminal-related transcriptional regulator [Thermomicrobiales bacterium]